MSFVKEFWMRLRVTNHQIDWNEDESRDIDLYGYPNFEKRLRDVVVNLVEMANPEK